MLGQAGERGGHHGFDLRRDPPAPARVADREHSVHQDPVRLELDRRRVAEAEHRRLHAPVRRRLSASEDAAVRARHHDAAVAARSHVGHRRARGPHRRRDVDGHEVPEIFGRHVLDGGAVVDAGVVDEDVERAELVERGPDDLGGSLACLHRGVARDRGPSRGTDLVDDQVSRRPRTVARGPAVHHDARPAASELERIEAPQTAAAARHDGYPSFEIDRSHGFTFPTRGRRPWRRSSSSVHSCSRW